MLSIYVLKLECDKYYIGKSKNANERIEQHFNNEGSSWTKKFKPIEVVEIIDNVSPFDEDKYTLIYMNKYGIKNVRGGSFCQVRLNDTTKMHIKKMLQSNNDLCYNCKREGHIAADCTKSCSNSYSDSDSENDYIDSYSNFESAADIGYIGRCYICKRSSHIASDCFASKDINGNTITQANRECCYRCGRLGHWVLNCKEKYDIFGKEPNHLVDSVSNVVKNVTSVMKSAFSWWK